MAEKQYTTAAHTTESLIHIAVKMKASDIHFEPFHEKMQIRFRIDGILKKVQSQSSQPIESRLASEIIAYIKVVARMRTDEHNFPQDGRFALRTRAGTQVNIRVSIMPTHYGEKAVLRLLPEHASTMSLGDLGFSKHNQQKLQRALQQNVGMIIVTGPTGSGKTTTLYHCLESVQNKEGLSIATLEDPVEYSIPGVTQIPINEARGFDFQQGLRSLLRQDPDTIMVGEIRDEETARLAIQASLTGHRVLTTLHTANSVSAIPRLINMGIEPYLIAATVKLIISQRLVRKICADCRTQNLLTDALWQHVRHSMSELKLIRPEHIYSGKGCSSCLHSGYSGRIGIYELLEVSEKIKSASIQRKSSRVIKHIALKEGMTELWSDCWRKVVAGITTAEELTNISYE